MIIASIDIGTNTVLLLIAKTEPDSNILSPILNEYRMPRLGSGLIPGRNIKRDRILQLFQILEEYALLITKHKADKVLLTATNAFRIADNALYIVNEIKSKFNWDVDIISGESEAEFAFLGAVSVSMGKESTLVIDIGGGSSELIHGSIGNIVYRKSFKTGSVSSTESFMKNSPPSLEQLNRLNIFLDKTFDELKRMSAPDRVIAISGTPTTIACMVKGLKEYDDDLIEGSYLKSDELRNLIKHLSTLSSDEIKSNFGSVMNGREDIILGGSLILLKIIELLKLPEIIISSKGIRYGAIVSYLSSMND